MFTGSSDTKERIRDAIDIVDLVSESIALRRQGRNFVGLCPWHSDSNPSLQVNQQRQSWKCWVCDIGGDVFSFVMQREGVEFREALEMLAERTGVTLSNRAAPKPPPGSPKDKNTLYRAMDWAARTFHQFLVEAQAAEPGRRYLSDRNVNQGSIERFQIGYVPNQWSWLIDRAAQVSFSPQVLEAVGLAIKSDHQQHWYDRFRGRIIFPIRDAHHRTIGVGGRILPEFADKTAAKYINSPETRLFSKSDQLFGLDLARDAIARQDQALVMEGYTDVIMARQAGLNNAVAVLGTALGSKHVRLLKRFTDRIVLVLDGDAAGQRRANEILDLFIAHQIDLRIVTLPDNLDPCDFLLTQGREAMEGLVSDAPDAWEYKINLETHGINLINDTHRANHALESLLQTLAKAPTIGESGSHVQRLREQQILTRLARQFGLDEQQLRQRLQEGRRRNTLQRPMKVDRQHGRSESTPGRVEGLGLDPMERDLFELLMLHPESIHTALHEISVEQLSTTAAKLLHGLMWQAVTASLEATCANLLRLTEDPALQNLLVTVDEQAHEKIATDWEIALDELLATFRRRQAERHLQQTQAALERNDLSDEEQIRLLRQLLERKQQIST